MEDVIPVKYSISICLGAALAAGVLGFIAGAQTEDKHHEKNSEEAKLFRTVLRHDKHSGVTVINAKQRVVSCDQCGILFCTDKAGIVADWSKIEDGAKIPWYGY